jgi:hypothetical protein
MALYDLVNCTLSVPNLLPGAALTGTAQGTAADLSNCEVDTAAIIVAGAYANQSTFAVQLEECSTTNGTFTVIPGATVQLSTLSSNGVTTGATTTFATNSIVTFSTTNQQAMIRALRTQRYARLNVITNTGTTVAMYVTGEIISQLKISGDPKGYSRSPST